VANWAVSQDSHETSQTFPGQTERDANGTRRVSRMCTLRWRSRKFAR